MTITLKKLHLLRLQEALNLLDAGYENGDGKKRPFQWKEGGKVRYHIYRLMKLVDDRVEMLNKARMGLVQQFRQEQEDDGVKSPSEDMPLTPHYVAKFNSAYQSLLLEEEELEVRLFSADLLDLDRNPVSCQALSVLEGRLFEAPKEFS